MGKQAAPAPPDFIGAAKQQGTENRATNAAQTAANRPNQTNAFGAGVQWTQAPDGSWQQSQSFGNGGLGQFAQGAQAQLGQTQPFDLGQFGQVQDGSAAADEAYTQATARLNPEWQQRETQMRSRLANQGLDPNSEAARGASRQFEQGRNDAYGQARAQSFALGDSVFRNNMMARQQMIAEALRQRGMPLEDLQRAQGLLSQQPFGMAGAAQPTPYYAATRDQYGADLSSWEAEQQRIMDYINGGAQIAGTAAKLYAL